jgi:predicted transposase YbfD/YdcC
MVETTREVGGTTSTEGRYYLSSLPVDVERFPEAVRGHWGIEKSCHWILDVVFGEDDSRVRVGSAAQNLALIRRVALNLLQQEKTLKRGVKPKRLKAALDDRSLLKIFMTLNAFTLARLSGCSATQNNSTLNHWSPLSARMKPLIHIPQAFVGHIGVDLSCTQIGVSEHHLY